MQRVGARARVYTRVVCDVVQTAVIHESWMAAHGARAERCGCIGRVRCGVRARQAAAAPRHARRCCSRRRSRAPVAAQERARLHMSVRACVRASIRARMCVRTCVRMCLSARARVCEHAYVRTCVRAYTPRAQPSRRKAHCAAGTRVPWMVRRRAADLRSRSGDSRRTRSAHNAHGFQPMADRRWPTEAAGPQGMRAMRHWEQQRAQQHGCVLW